jgi:hypothetical protein
MVPQMNFSYTYVNEKRSPYILQFDFVTVTWFCCSLVCAILYICYNSAQEIWWEH